MANKIVRLAPGTKLTEPWPMEILAQDGWHTPVFMVRGGPQNQPLTWVPKATVIQWLADAGTVARVGG